jgi:hypothetical protein
MDQRTEQSIGAIEDHTKTAAEHLACMRHDQEPRKAAFIRQAVIALAAADRMRYGIGQCSTHDLPRQAEQLWEALPQEYR